MTRFKSALLAAAMLRTLTFEVDVLAQEPRPASADLVLSAPGPEEPGGFPKEIELTDPEAAKQYGELEEVDVEIQDRLRKYMASDNDTIRIGIRTNLVAMVERQFTIRQAIRERELQRIEAELKRLRTVHDQRNAQSAKIVENRVQQLITDAEGLGWGTTADISSPVQEAMLPPASSEAAIEPTVDQ